MLLFIGQQMYAQNSSTKRYQGLLWEISGKGTTRPSYLYGTMHVPEKLAYNLSDSFFVALRNCDYVSLETDHDVWQEFMQKMKEDNETFGYAENSFYPSYAKNNNYGDLYGQYFKFDAPDSRLFEGMFSYKPVMANEFLYRSNGYGEDFEEDTYLDLFIFQAGKKLGKKVIGLETMDGSYESVTRARIPDDDAEEIDVYSNRYISPFSIRDAYRKQDLNALDSLNAILSPGKNFKKWMLEVRNIVMADGIDSIARTGKNMFSAVGAAHLPGDIGVIEQLRKRGYTVRPVQFSFDTDKKDKQEIEKMRFPVTFSTQWAPDSVWSAQAPGKFYTTSEMWRIEQSLCADMSNGAYYAVYRVKTNGLWTGQTPEYISTRIDSLIYEKVPGKIQERKRINTPFQGYDITTRTRRGDIQRYKVYITATEILMFIMGGNGDYVAGDEGQRFFNSIQLNPAKTIVQEKKTWVEPVSGSFKVQFPTVPFVNTTTDKAAKDTYIAGQEKNPDDGFYFLTRVTYDDYYYIEEDSFELNIIAEKVAAQFTKENPTLTPVTLSPYPTQTFSFKSDKDSSFYFGKLVIDGPQYYLLGARNRTGKSPDAFFNSFEIKRSSMPEGWMVKNDTSGKFTVTIPQAEEKKPSQLYLNLKKINEEIVKKSRGQYNDDYDAYEDYRTYATTLEHKPTGESIVISSGKFYSDAFPDLDSLKRVSEKLASQFKKLRLDNYKFENRNDTLLVITHTAADTNSSRAIMSKVFYTRDRHYSLMVNVNGDAPVSPFVQKVFETFMPTDSSLGKKIVFGGRDISFFDRIYSKDTLEGKKALAVMRSFMASNYKKEDFDKIAATINTPEFHKLKFNDKTALLRAISHTKSPKVLPFLQTFFTTYADSVRYQNEAVLSMIQLKTKDAWKASFALMGQKETYLDYSTVNTIQYYLSDSLELAAQFVDELLDISQNETYSSMALGVITTLYEREMIKPKKVKTLKQKFLVQEYQNLGRARYRDENARDKNAYKDYGYGGGYGGGRYGGQGGYTYPAAYGGDYGGTSIAYSSGLSLLVKFYEEDPEVRQLFDQILLKGAKYDKLEAIRVLLKAGKKISNTHLEPLAQNDETRFRLYEMMITSGTADPYKSWFSDTIALARSYVLQFTPSEEIDSVKFIQKSKSVTYDKKPAMMYFFDVKRKKTTEWKLNYVTLPLDFGLKGPSKDKSQTGVASFATSNYDYYGDYNTGSGRLFQVMIENNLTNDKDKLDFIRKKVGEIRFAGRLRYREERNNNYYYNDY